MVCTFANKSLLFKLSLSQLKIYFFFEWQVVAVHFYIISFLQSAMSGQSVLTLQLKSRVSSVSLWSFFMSFDYLWHVLSTTTAYFNGVFVKDFERKKSFSIKFKNIFAMLVDISELNGGLNQMIWRFAFFSCVILFTIKLFIW